jgi:hypothetical protein
LVNNGFNHAPLAGQKFVTQAHQGVFHVPFGLGKVLKRS